MAPHLVDEVAVDERRFAREHLVGDAAEAVEVGADVGAGGGARLLGRHVIEGAEESALLGELAAFVARSALVEERLAQADVEDLDDALGGALLEISPFERD